MPTLARRLRETPAPPEDRPTITRLLATLDQPGAREEAQALLARLARPRGRPRTATARKPSRSGKHRLPTPEQAADQRVRLHALRVIVGDELRRRGELLGAAGEPCSVYRLAAVLDRHQPDLAAWGAGDAPARRVCRVLAEIEADAAAWRSGS